MMADLVLRGAALPAWARCRSNSASESPVPKAPILRKLRRGHAVAESLLGTPDREHGSFPCDRNGPAAVTTPILV